MRFEDPKPDEFLPGDRVPGMAFMVSGGVVRGFFLPWVTVTDCIATVVRFKTNERALVSVPEGPADQVLNALRRAAVTWLDTEEGAESVGQAGWAGESIAGRARKYGELPA